MCRDAALFPPLEMWGGIECTVSRVGEQTFDQLEWSGHAVRPGDLDLIAALGIRTLRYPVLWERIAPDPARDPDWTWPDERLGRLRALDIRPIVGLVHHGSGPRHTSLVDGGFALGLVRFARQVAERYPWVDHYTPVNEPLTTARFSGLYGHWYPHGRDGLTFARALLTQCRAVVLAMRAVRQVRPDARLVQTEDLGRATGTPALAYQVEFDNQRRWLSFDLLCGRVDRCHPLWCYFRYVGIDEAEVAWFLDNPCPPDVVGLNYYLTGERYLDDRLERYPAYCHGGNGRHRYADVETVRACPEGLAGAAVLLGEAWQRYGLPLAVTEAHLGCTREEQMRWLLEVWQGAKAARRGGADVRAVTVWSMLGAYDWDSLLTQPRGHYEPGAFDVRSGRPRPTALAALVRDLAAGHEPDQPVLSSPGWWQRPERLLYGDRPVAVPESPPAIGGRAVEARPVLIAGASGVLGRAFSTICWLRGVPHLMLGRRDLDITDGAAVAEAVDRIRPWAVFNAAGYVHVDAAEREPDVCHRDNVLGPAILAEVCRGRRLALLTVSSDLVFDGSRTAPYRESDAVAPLSVYGRAKAEAERRVRALHPGALVVRSSAFFGPWDEGNFVTRALRALRHGQRFFAAAETVSPTYVPDLAHACLDLLIDGADGVWHLATPGAVTRAELARLAARRAGLDESAVEVRPGELLGRSAPRPRYSVLGSERGLLLQPLADALECYFRDCQQPADAADCRRGGALETPALPSLQPVEIFM